MRFLTGEKRKVSGADAEHLRNTFGGRMPDGTGIDRVKKPAWIREAEGSIDADQERLNRLVRESKRSGRLTA